MDHSHHILNIAERQITGQSVLTSDENTRVRFDSVPLEEGGYRYSVTGSIPLERATIATLMARPLGIEADWQEVRDGLRDVSYPSKSIRALSRTAVRSAQLSALRPATKELADILTNNQLYRTYTVNAPIFQYGSSYDYAATTLFAEAPGKLMNQLRSIGIKPALARKLAAYIQPDLQTPEATEELRALTGLSDEQVHSWENELLLGDVEPRLISELIHRQRDEQFIGFTRQAVLEAEGLRGGGFDESVFLLERDVPASLLDRANVAVAVGGILRDRDRKTGRERHRVTFYSESPLFVAHPRLVWDNQNGQRTLQLPPGENEFDQRYIARPSSLVGAALAANHFGPALDIRYREALGRSIGRRSKKAAPLPLAGMLPLVLEYRQNELLDAAYFEAVEKALE